MWSSPSRPSSEWVSQGVFHVGMSTPSYLPIWPGPCPPSCAQLEWSWASVWNQLCGEHMGPWMAGKLWMWTPAPGWLLGFPWKIAIFGNYDGISMEKTFTNWCRVLPIHSMRPPNFTGWTSINHFWASPNGTRASELKPCDFPRNSTKRWHSSRKKKNMASTRRRNLVAAKGTGSSTTWNWSNRFRHACGKTAN